MKKKDIIVIAIILLVCGLGFGAMKLMNNNGNTPENPSGIVYYGNKPLFYFDIDEDATYTFRGDYGKMNLEVKDGAYRVYDVECPNQICVHMGWLAKDDLFAAVGITCIPNNVAIICDMGE